VLTRVAVCGGMAAMRLAELAFSRRNIEANGGADESATSRRVYPLIVAVHTLAIGGTALFGRRARVLPLVLLLAVQPLRLWVLLTLGRRWNARGAVAHDLRIETGGPYAFVRHPNYAVVIAELALLPLAFRLPRLAAFVSLANGALLAVRIREEERALMAVPGYREHFARRRRFLPGVI
jgi:methyltransferase